MPTNIVGNSTVTLLEKFDLRLPHLMAERKSVNEYYGQRTRISNVNAVDLDTIHNGFHRNLLPPLVPLVNKLIHLSNIKSNGDIEIFDAYESVANDSSPGLSGFESRSPRHHTHTHEMTRSICIARQDSLEIHRVMIAGTAATASKIDIPGRQKRH